MGERFWAGAVSRLDGAAQDGIHLLWVPPQAAGYSVRGFDIQRRASKRKPEIDCLALSGAELDLLHRRTWFANTMAVFAFSRAACPQFPPGLPDEPYSPDPTDKPPQLQCLNFRHVPEGDGPNPLVQQGVRFTRYDAGGTPEPTSRVSTVAGRVGLSLGFRLEIALPAASSEVEVTLIHFSRPAKAVAMDAAGTVVDSASMTAARNTPETLTLHGAGITRVIVDAPQNEAFLLDVCYPLQASRCIEFNGEQHHAGPNPRIEQDVSFEALSRDGKSAAGTDLRSVSGIVGLQCTELVRVRFGESDSVELTLLVGGGRATITAYNSDGKAVDKASLAANPHPQIAVLHGSGLAGIEIRSTSPKKTLLLKFCIQSTPALTAGERLTRKRLSTLARDIKSDVARTATDPQRCLRYRITLREVHHEVRVEIGVTGVFAIALRDGKAVATLLKSDPAAVQLVRFTLPIDEVLLYVTQPARSLRVCVDRVDDAASDREWRREPYIAKGIQIPAHAVNSAVSTLTTELALATGRLLPGEAITAARFQEVSALINDVCAQTNVVSPVLRTTRTRRRTQDPLVELRSWAYILTLLSDPAWRRALGFGYFDPGGGLVAGTVYDYRITGYFRRRDLEETTFGFHTIPSDTALPGVFYLGPIRVATLQPASVEMVPAAVATSLKATGRKGLRLSAGQHVTLTFPTTIQRLVLELEPSTSQTLRYQAKTSDYIPGLTGTLFQAPIPAAARVAIDFAEPVDTVELRGTGFVYAIRFEGNGAPDDIIPASVVVYGVRYEATNPPATPPFLGTTNLQQPSLPGDPAITTRTPPESVGFHLSWLPPPLSGNTPLPPWPPDVNAAPPFDVVGFHLERRRVDVPSAFQPIDDDPEPTLYVGSRGGRTDPPPLCDGIDLLAQFPEKPQAIPPVSAFMTADDVLIGEFVTAPPPPGSLHQYRIVALDVLGRRSAPRVGSIVRLEKRRAPPPPVAPETPPPAGAIVPPGVRARVLRAADPDITAADRTLVGASQNAVVLEWGWTQRERDMDPYAREFRIYWQPNPPDLIPAELTGTAALVGGKWNMSASFARAVAANAMQGQFVRTGGRPFRVASHDAGFVVTMVLDQSAIDPTIAPTAGRFDFRPKLDGAEMRPSAWPERVATVAIGPNAPQPFVLRDRLVLDALHPFARAWIGVSSADDQSYIPDEIPAAQPNGGRPGNESSIASVVAEARYIGRPVFVVPDPLPAVPESVTREPAGETVTQRIDLPALLPGVVVPANYTVLVEQISIDTLLTFVTARADDQIGVTFPDDSTTTYTLGNPGDQTAFLAQLRTGMAARVEGRFAMDFLLRFKAQLEELWKRTIAQPVPWAAIDAVLPSKPNRYVHRVRLVDPAGHSSAGAGIAPQIVRVASLRAPRAPELTVTGDATDALAVTATVNESYDLRWIVLFKVTSDAAAPPTAATLERAQLLRLPDRRDLYPNDGLRLRLADGTVATPAAALDLIAAGVVNLPKRSVSTALPVGFDRRAAVWALALTRDGIPSRFAGPVLGTSGAAPLVIPALSMVAGASTDDATWGIPPVPADVALERSLDAGATWSRVSPWLAPSVTNFSVNRAVPAVARMYRLTLRASRDRSAVGAGVALP